MNGKTVIVFNTKTNKVSVCFAKKPTQDQLDAACKAVPNGFAEQLDSLTIPQLTALYNANSDADVNEIKKFANKAAAVERTAAVLTDVPVWDGKETKVASTTTTLAEGVAKSWTNPEVRAARSERHGIKVGKTEYPSILAAYRDLGMDLKFHRDHRLALKAAMPKGIKDDEGRMWKAFER